MKWSEDFNIGFERVDFQHQELCHMVDQLEQNYAGTCTDKGVADALKFIVDYTRYHFREEETLMREISYPEIENHQKLHKELIDQVTAILLQLKAGHPLQIADLLTFLISWVKNHIIDEDKKIGAFIKNTDLHKIEKTHRQNSLNGKEALEIKVKLLRDLFQKKLISAEDVKEKRLHLFIHRGQELGMKNLRYFIDELDHLIQMNFIGNNDKKQSLIRLLEENDHSVIVNESGSIEEKLFYLRVLQSVALIDQATFETLNQLSFKDL